MQELKRSFIYKLIILGSYFGITVSAIASESPFEGWSVNSYNPTTASFVNQADPKTNARLLKARTFIANKESSEVEAQSVLARSMKIEDPIESLAKQGDVEAQYFLGVQYDIGFSRAKDYKKAFEWYEKAANQGLDKAQYSLGLIYQKGYGVYGAGKDYKKAFEWYEKAAKQGLASSQNNLGYMYTKGLGVRQDYKKAFEWYEKAAKQGLASSQNNLGRAYLKGDGVRQNKAKAKEIFGKSCDSGNQEGCDNYRLLNQQPLVR